LLSFRYSRHVWNLVICKVLTHSFGPYLLQILEGWLIIFVNLFVLDRILKLNQVILCVFLIGFPDHLLKFFNKSMSLICVGCPGDWCLSWCNFRIGCILSVLKLVITTSTELLDILTMVSFSGSSRSNSMTSSLRLRKLILIVCLEIVKLFKKFDSWA